MRRFDRFVVFAEMRTGSNALEEAINQIDGLACHGEAFNPAFMGHEGQASLFGVDLAAREKAPLSLLAAMSAGTDGIAGFRFFHDHDPRVLAEILPDPRCAKVLLTRDPVESYVSLKIARATGQWTLTDPRHRRRARIRFDRAEFEAMRARHDAFRAHVRRTLQETGQTAYPVDFSEIGDLAVINGLARFLGAAAPLAALKPRLKRQNPEPLHEKVENPEALEGLSHGLSPEALPAEPVPGASLGSWVAARDTPLLFVPLKGGPVARIERWLAALDGASPDALPRGFSRKTLRQWKKRHKDGRSFTVVCHPAERAHRVFCRHILGTGPEAFPAIRDALRTRYGVPLPEGAPGPGWDSRAHREAFVGFLGWARANNAGQTGQRSDPAWASQQSLLTAASGVLVPDAVLREAELAEDLPRLASKAGAQAAPPLPCPDAEEGPFRLSEIHDDTVEEAVRALHRRDYMAFGYRRWRAAP